MKATIIIKANEGLTGQELNDLMDRLQDVRGVYSVSMAERIPSPDQFDLLDLINVEPKREEYAA